MIFILKQKKKKKTKEKKKTKQQKKFMIHTHDKFINYIFCYFILHSSQYETHLL